MPSEIKAAVLREFNQPLSVESITIDDPASNEVLVKTVASGLCHSDLHFIEGKQDVPLAAVLGHEPSGIIEAVGSEVQGFEPGDHVVACTSQHCGRCAQCHAGYQHLCSGQSACLRSSDEKPRLSQKGNSVFQMSGLASFAEKMLIHESGLVKIDSEIPLDRAALTGCAVTTGVGAALNTAEVRPGSAVVVFGCGGVGISVIQGARIAGARQIIAIDIVDKKLEQAKEFGATHVLNGSTVDVVRSIKKITNGGADFSFDAVGNKHLVEQALYCLAPRGVATMVGAIYPVTDKLELKVGHFFAEKRIQGCYMGSNRFHRDVPRYLDLYSQGRLNLDDMISQRITLDEINNGFEAMKSGDIARAVVVFDSSLDG